MGVGLWGAGGCERVRHGDQPSSLGAPSLSNRRVARRSDCSASTLSTGRQPGSVRPKHGLPVAMLIPAHTHSVVFPTFGPLRVIKGAVPVRIANHVARTFQPAYVMNCSLPIT